MKDFIQIQNKIPPDIKNVECENFTTVENSVLAITNYSIYQFRIDENTCDSRIIDWLNGLNFSLKGSSSI